MKEREHTHYHMINCRKLLPLFLSVCFPVKISHFRMFFFFLDNKKVDYETNNFFVNSTGNLPTHKKNSVQLLAIIATNHLFARVCSLK